MSASLAASRSPQPRMPPSPSDGLPRRRPPSDAEVLSNPLPPADALRGVGFTVTPTAGKLELAYHGTPVGPLLFKSNGAPRYHEVTAPLFLPAIWWALTGEPGTARVALAAAAEAVADPSATRAHVATIAAGAAVGYAYVVESGGTRLGEDQGRTTGCWYYAEVAAGTRLLRRARERGVPGLVVHASPHLGLLAHGVLTPKNPCADEFAAIAEVGPDVAWAPRTPEAWGSRFAARNARRALGDAELVPS